MRRSLEILLAVAVLSVVACTPVVVGDWALLGERVVADRVESDSIPVSSGEGQFTALRLRVLRRPVHFIDVRIVYANGRVQDVPLRNVVPAGGETRVIDLVGSDRSIRRVEFRYEAQSRGRGKRATVQLFGRR